jgi:hypothetical protein
MERPMKAARAVLPALILLGLPLAAQAVLHVDLGEPRANEWTVTYTFVDSEPGKKSMEVLPYDSEIEVLEAVPEKGGAPLKWERINEGEEGKPKVRVEYPEAIEPGKRYSFRLVAKMKDPNAYFEDTAKLNFLYRTGHEIYVSLPRGFYPIYTDEPMELKQETERVVLSSKGGKERPVVIFAVRCGGPRKAPAPPSPSPTPAARPDSVEE